MTRRAIRPIAAAAAGLAVLAMSAGVAYATAGELDPTFGDGGKKLLPFYAEPYRMLVQPNGKIVLVGEYLNGEDIVVWRFNADGSPDRTFDGDGVAIADFGGDDNGLAAALQGDGKVVVAGYRRTYMDNAPIDAAVIARFDTDGSLDETFDPGGADGDGKKVFADPDIGYAAVAVQPDGNILMGGGGYDFQLVRLTPAGAIEKRFDEADFGGHEYIGAVAPTPEGGVVAAGVTTPGTGDPDIAVARYTPEGRLDETFAGTGKTTVGADGAELLTALLVHPDGGITLAGTGGYGGLDPTMLAIRLGRDGTVDDGYGAAGTAVANFDGDDDAVAAALQPDGKVVVAGTAYAPPSLSVAAARFDSSGALDASFGSGGRSTFTVGDYSRSASAALQPDGKLLIVGVALQGLVGRMFLARLQADRAPNSGGEPGDSGGPGDTPNVPRCAGRRATIVGTARSDTLRGTRRADVIVGLGGSDRIRALAGNDLVCAGRGNDVVAGGRGRDTLRGEAGRDVLRGGAGRDSLLGGTGTNRLHGGSGRDRCVGPVARDGTSGCESRRRL